jgi:hypothetical protein
MGDRQNVTVLKVDFDFYVTDRIASARTDLE